MKNLITLLALTASTVAFGSDLYLEDFLNSSNGTNFNTGWNWGNADASLASLVVDGTGVRHETWSQSNLSSLPAVGNSPVGSGSDMGVPFTPFNGSTSRFMYTLEVASLNLTVGDVKGFQADIRKRDNVNQIWFGIMSGNTWYFTQNTLEPILDDNTGDPDYYRYVIPATNMVEINQVWDNATGWGVDRNPINPDNVVGPASLTATDPIGGFALLFTTQVAQLGNLYIDNVGLSSVPEPGMSALLVGLSGLLWIAARRRRRGKAV